MALTHLEAAVVATVRSMSDEELLEFLISALSAQVSAVVTTPKVPTSKKRRGSTSPPSISSLEDEVIAALQRLSHEEGVSMGQLAVATSGTDNQVRAAVRKLEARGLVARSGERRFTRYRLAKSEVGTRKSPTAKGRANRGIKKRRPKSGPAAPPKRTKVGASRGSKVTAAASQLEKAVERIVRESDGLAMGEIVKAADASRNDVRAAVLALKSAGKIHQGGERRFSRYAATAKAAKQASLRARGKA